MKIAVLGTGMVGQGHTKKLAEMGHDVIVGTRRPQDKKIEGVNLVSFAEAAKHGELIIEALNGKAVLRVLKPLKKRLEGKVLIDISNALDFSSGDVQIFTANKKSIGEQLQAALPKTKVVKAFNTANIDVQINPQSLAGGDHHLFVCGNDQAAKKQVIKLARSYGWKDIIDLGDIKAAHGLEMLMPFWLSVRSTLDSSDFNYKIAQ